MMARPYTAWTGPQIRRLKALYPVTPLEELAVLFVPHSIEAIRMAAWRAGMTRANKRKQRNWMAICRAHRPVFVLTEEVV
jgi:hypothetical protein